MLTATTEWSNSATNDTTKNYYPKHVAVQNVWYYQPNNTIATYRNTVVAWSTGNSARVAALAATSLNHSVQCSARHGNTATAPLAPAPHLLPATLRGKAASAPRGACQQPPQQHAHCQGALHGAQPWRASSHASVPCFRSCRRGV